MNFIFQFLVIFGLVMVGNCKVILQSRASKKYIRNVSDSVVFNVILFSSIAFFIALFFKQSTVSTEVLLYGTAVAVATMVFQIGYAISLSTGPVSISVMIMNFSALVSTLFSLFCFKEQLYVTQLAGMVLLVVSIILSVDNAGGAECTITGKWLCISLVAMLANGTAGCAMKLYSVTSASKQPGSDMTMLVVAYSIAALLALLFFLLKRYTGKKTRLSFSIKSGLPLYAIAAGAVLAVYQKINMYAMATIDGSFMFPTNAGLASLTMALIGIIMFGDRLTKRQLVGVFCGFICVVLMNMRFGVSFYIA